MYFKVSTLCGFSKHTTTRCCLLYNIKFRFLLPLSQAYTVTSLHAGDENATVSNELTATYVRMIMDSA